MPRPTDDQLFMELAVVTAKRSLCDRAQVGAVIVSRQQVVISTGRNGPPRLFKHDERTCTHWCLRAQVGDTPHYSSYDNCPSLHAEVNALLSSDRSRHQYGTIYVSSPMCYGCAKIVANSGISRVVALADPTKDVERDTERTYEFLRSLGIEVNVMKLTQEEK